MGHKLNLYKILKFAIIPVDVLFIIILLLNYFNQLPAFWNKSILYVFYLILAINTAYLALKINKIPEHEKNHHSIVYLSKYFFLLGLIVIVVNQFLKRQIIIDYMSYIIGLIIALGFLTFYASRDRVEKEIEDEKASEEQAEKKRYDEFGNKFPRINKIWGLRSIVRWMYKEGWWYSVGLILIVVYGSFLIFSNLGANEIYHDEQWHLQVVESLKQGEGFRLWN